MCGERGRKVDVALEVEGIVLRDEDNRPEVTQLFHCKDQQILRFYHRLVWLARLCLDSKWILYSSRVTT